MDLYLDFDGVIIDTITSTNSEIKRKTLKTLEDIHEYFCSINWEELINNSPVIKDAINNIKKIINSKIFNNVYIITHCHSENEIKAKDKFIKNKLSEITKVYYVDYKVGKENVVDPKGNVLVDDFAPNIQKWINKEGIGIKFSNTEKISEFTKINDLEELIDLFKEDKLVKRRTYGTKKY